jgi:hypothetical protein
VSFAAITLCIASQRAFVVVVYFVMAQSGNFRIHSRITFWSEILKGRALGRYSCRWECNIRVKRFSEKLGRKSWPGFIWLRTGASSRLL